MSDWNTPVTWGSEVLGSSDLNDNFANVTFLKTQVPIQSRSATAIPALVFLGTAPLSSPATRMTLRIQPSSACFAWSPRLRSTLHKVSIESSRLDSVRVEGMVYPLSKK